MTEDANRLLGLELSRADWLEVWRAMLKTEELIGVVMARLSADGMNNAAPTKSRRAFVWHNARKAETIARALRKRFEASWRSNWGNLVDFRLWAMD